MSLSKVFLVRLKSSRPLRERCQFAKEVCSQNSVSLCCKEALVVNWLVDELNNQPSDSIIEVWETLQFVLQLAKERSITGCSLLLKNAFASTIFTHVRNLACKCPCDVHADFAKSIMKCVSCLLEYSVTSSVFGSQPAILFNILAICIKIENELMTLGIGSDELLNSCFVIIKHVVKNQLQPHEKVLEVLVHDCLEPIIMFIYYVGLQDKKTSVCAKSICNLLVEWLKTTLAHSHLNKSYKQFLELENSNHAKSHLGIRALMYKIGTMLKSDHHTLVKATAGLMSFILQGMLAKLSQSSLDLPFSILVYFVKLLVINRDDSTLYVLNQLLQVCHKNTSLLSKCGEIPTAEKLAWFRETTMALICSKMPVTSSLFKCFTLLLSVSPNILDPQLQEIWTISLYTSNLSQLGDQTDFMCTLLRTYISFRQVPKLISKLILSIKENVSLGKQQEPDLPKLFLVQFSECMVSLPAGQVLELWEHLLDCGIFLLQKNLTEIYPQPIVKLFCALLTHIKIYENQFPVGKVHQLTALMNGTQEHVRQVILVNKAPSSDVLSLCYALGEVLLTSKVYQMNLQKCLSITDSKTSLTSNLYDLSKVHPYLNENQWTIYLSQLDLSEGPLKNSVALLLIQKARSLILLNHSDPNVIKSVICSIASHIFQLAAEENNSGETTLCRMSTDMMDTLVVWLPLLFPSLSSMKMVQLCQLLFDSMIASWKTENSLTKLVLKSNFFLESRLMQTAFITCLWGECNSALKSLKRKHASNSETNHILKLLSKHPKLWQKFSETKAEDASDQDNEMWFTFKKLSTEFCEQSNEQCAIGDVERVLHLIQFLKFFPLEDIELGNQMRCVLGLFQLLLHLDVSKHQRKSELHIMICQSLSSLLTKIPTKRMAMLFQTDAVLLSIFSVLMKSESKEEERWSLILMEKLVHVFITINDMSSLEKVELFTKQLDNSTNISIRKMQILNVIIKRLLSLFNRHIQNSESFQVYDRLTKSMVNDLSKQLLSTTDLPQKLAFQCVNCILAYHCKVVPPSMETVKRRSARYVKHHLTTIESLILCDTYLDSDTAEVFFKLVGLICRNRLQIEEYLPEKFILRVWDVICRNITSPEKKAIGGNAKTDFKVISSVMKSLTPDERVEALKKLNTQCKFILSNHNTSELVKFIPVWTLMVNTDFADLPKELSPGITKFLNILLPLLLQPLDNKRTFDVVLPILQFVGHLLQKNKMPLKHSQVLLCFQACACLNLSSLEINSFLPLCTNMIVFYKRLLTRVSQVVLQSVAPFLSCLSVILKQLVRSGNDTDFKCYSDSTKKELLLCVQDFSKLLALVANHKTEFNKQAGFLIADYLSEVQNITVNLAVKEPLLLGIYKMLDICNDHEMAMLQVTLTSGAREILKQMHSEFNQYYRYKGRV